MGQNFLVIDWEALPEITHPRWIRHTAIHRSNVIIHTYASGIPRFPVAEGAILLKYIENLKLTGEGSLFKQFRPWGRRKNKARREARAHLEPYDPNETAEAPLLQSGGSDEDKIKGTLFGSEVGVLEASDEPAPTPVEESPEDYWTMPSNNILMRHHVSPRRH